MRVLLLSLLLVGSVNAASWECIERAPSGWCQVERIYAVNGWLIKAEGYNDYTFTFIPDPDKKWK